MTTIRIGSRGSQLALWQANHVAQTLRNHGHTVEIEVIRTTGDRMQQPGFSAPAGSESPDGRLSGGKGIFIKEIEEALAAGRIDLAVHSLKDLPTALDPRFTLAAIPPRADARDAWVCEPWWALHTLPEGGRIGTTSPRRRAQLLALRPDVTFVELRGNVDTRLRKLEEGACDALVLASAGLDRLERTEAVHRRFALDEMTPAPGQGALALETRSPQHPLDSDDPARDPAVFAAVCLLDDARSRFATDAERAFLAALGGGCELALGAHCFESAAGWTLIAQVLAPDGEQMVQVEVDAAKGEPASSLGQRTADLAIGRGALDLLVPADDSRPE
jgi:hydroxymethylbilane synthase